jgi:hypothetical protein
MVRVRKDPHKQRRLVWGTRALENLSQPNLSQPKGSFDCAFARAAEYAGRERGERFAQDDNREHPAVTEDDKEVRSSHPFRHRRAKRIGHSQCCDSSADYNEKDVIITVTDCGVWEWFRRPMYRRL